MRKKSPFEEAVELRNLTYSGWLYFIKKIPNLEISINMPDDKELREEYEEWLSEKPLHNKDNVKDESS